MAEDPAEYLWRQQSRWSQAAGRMKTALTRARLLVLALTVVGAVLGTAAAAAEPGGPNRVLALAAAVALALIPFARRGASAQATRDWALARSIAEALKSDVHTYLARAHPFHDTDRGAELLRRAEAHLDDAGDLVKHLAGIDPLPRDLPAVHDLESYARIRVRGQVEQYYRPKARALSRTLTRLRRAETALALTAAVLLAVAAAAPASGLGVWIGVLTTVAGALGAHIGTERHEFRLLEFTRTADRLERLLAGRAVGGRTVTDFTTDCELVIATQNQSWLAKLSLDEPQEAQPPPTTP